MSHISWIRWSTEFCCFPQEMPHKWKDHYALSVPWGGSVQALVALSIGVVDENEASSSNFSIHCLVDAIDIFHKLYDSKHWSFFSIWKFSNFISGNGIILFYYVWNKSFYFSHFSDCMPNIIEMRKDLKAYHHFTAPGVEMHCLFGNNVDTSER